MRQVREATRPARAVTFLEASATKLGPWAVKAAGRLAKIFSAADGSIRLIDCSFADGAGGCEGDTDVEATCDESVVVIEGSVDVQPSAVFCAETSPSLLPDPVMEKGYVRCEALLLWQSSK